MLPGLGTHLQSGFPQHRPLNWRQIFARGGLVGLITVRVLFIATPK